MTNKPASIFASFMTAAITAAVSLSPFAASAQTPGRQAALSEQGPWSVAVLASESDGYRIEAYKLDRDLVAWTELNEAKKERRLYAFDGRKVRLLASMPSGAWSETAYFYDAVSGSFDAADGTVAWVASDGHDREIYAWSGEEVFQVSSNGYDDKHPVVSRGRIAWTSSPGVQPNLMVREPDGRVHKVAQWHVPNYVFSGKNLFWIERRQDRPSAFQVIAHDGKGRLTAGGNADDKTLANYFVADGEGSVAWEYYPKWDSEEHEYWHSLNGAKAVKLTRRHIAQHSPRLEDVNGPEILLNSKDWVYSYNQRHLGNSLLKVRYDLQEQTEMRRRELTKARYMSDGYVTHLVSETSSPLVMHNGTDSYLSLDIVVHDVFDADGDAAAGGVLGKGVLLYADKKATVVPTIRQVRSVAVKNGSAAWIDGGPGKGNLAFASRTVMVRTQSGAKTVGGRLLKAKDGKTVYLAATDGMRYSFPGEGQFYGWYADFDSVQTVSKASLEKLPLGGTVLHRAGTRLLKLRTSQTVYAIGKDGVIHPITNDLAAREIAGHKWKERVDVVNDARLADYRVGRQVDGITAYNAELAGIRF